MAEFNDEQKRVALLISQKLTLLGLDAKLIPELSVGPLLTVYRFLPCGSTRVSQLEGIASDIAITLKVEDVLVKRIPGEAAVGFYVPNAERRWVSFMDSVNAVWAARDSMSVPLGLGVDHLGSPVVEDLAELPHMLIAGSTGSGKSTLISSALSSLMYCVPPDRVQLILSDTKQVEFGHFIGSPHLLFDPLTSIYTTIEKMEWLCDQIEARLKEIASAGCRNIHEYNAKVKTAGQSRKTLSFIVLVIDELADILTDRTKEEKKGPSIGKVAEGFLSRIVQKSRAAGVYVIAGTQRPSVNIVAGSIKANFPARLTFRLPSGPDSRTVISTEGAEHLLSKGDCLYVSPLRAGLVRLHAPFARLEDIRTAVEMASHAHRALRLLQETK